MYYPGFGIIGIVLLRKYCYNDRKTLEKTMTDKEKYSQEMPKLLAEWKNAAHIYDRQNNPRADIFISDGIAHPENWFEQEIRPLFVLKEAYDNSGEHKDWDEVKWFLTNGEIGSGNKHGKIKRTTWQTLCRWSSYLFGNSYDIEPTWENESLRKIALINIKKYGGDKKSSDNDLRKHAEKHGDFIYKQINLIKPTIIICGYTGWLLDIVWEKIPEFNGGIRERKNQINGRVYNVPGMDNVKLIDFWHPSAWSTKVDLVEAFKNDVDIAKGFLGNSNETNESKDDN